MWNYWKFSCVLASVTGMKSTICCGMEWLVSFGVAYEPVGQGFESLPARQKKALFFRTRLFSMISVLNRTDDIQRV